MLLTPIASIKYSTVLAIGSGFTDNPCAPEQSSYKDHSKIPSFEDPSEEIPAHEAFHLDGNPRRYTWPSRM